MKGYELTKKQKDSFPSGPGTVADHIVGVSDKITVGKKRLIIMG
ncbi:hypothetical protein SRRS_06740 [Sporomusa rhizae]